METTCKVCGQKVQVTKGNIEVHGFTGKPIPFEACFGSDMGPRESYKDIAEVAKMHADGFESDAKKFPEKAEKFAVYITHYRTIQRKLERAAAQR